MLRSVFFAFAFTLTGMLHSVVAAEFRVDSAQVVADYQNGDFEKLDAALRPILKPGAACSHGDSLLAWKYLGVVYAARPATREKGRYCMLRLLDLDPSTDLIELFVGEEVDELFARARREHELTLRGDGAPPPVSGSAEAAAATDSTQATDTPVAIQAADDGHMRPWLVSALTAAAVAGIAWYSWENAPAHDKTYHVSSP